MAALSGLALLTFAVVWAVVHYSFIYIGGRGFDMIDTVQKPVLVPVGDAEHIRMELHMYYGDLQLKPGTVGLLTGTTRYNVAEFAPHVLYEEDGNRGRLLLDHLQNADMTQMIDRRGRINEWRLVMNDHLQIDELEVVVVLGRGHLDLRGSNLHHGTLELIAGDFTVDLRGTWAQDTLVQIDGVKGAITVLLPSETGTVVMLDNVPRTLHITGLAEWTAPSSLASMPAIVREAWGRSGEDGENHEYDSYVPDHKFYVNAAYEQSSTALYVQASHAFGTLNLIAE
jgi:hypothetical protein